MVEKSRKTLYISGKITGTTDYMERFSKAQAELEEKGYSVINPAAVNSMLPKNTTWKQYMDMSMTMLGMCDGIYMLDGWETSKGASMEFEMAKESGLEIYYQFPIWKQRLLNVFITR